jgi:hypothetical protein
VLLARHLPVTNRTTRSCDSFVEAALLDFLPPPSSSTTTLSGLAHSLNPGPSPAQLRRVIEVQKRPSRPASLQQPQLRLQPQDVDDELDELAVVVHSFVRTTTQTRSLYPEWAETLSLRSQSALSRPWLWLAVRDATRGELLAQSLVPLPLYRLQDRKPLTVTLPLQPPRMSPLI